MTPASRTFERCLSRLPSLASIALWHGLAIVLLLFPAACGRSGDSAAASLTLTIISPHGSDIRREFNDAFSNWHQQHFGTPVHIVWPDVGGGGTGNIVKQLDAVYAHADSSGYDIMFGGGSAAFGTFAAKGYLTSLPPIDAANAPWPSDPLLAVPPTIFGGPLHGKDKSGHDLWIAATMSAFGITINKDRIAELHLPTPRTWEDIAQPVWFGKLSLADPSKSGSVKTSFEMIFQQYGWEKGWVIITRLFENAALLRDNGGAPADDVGSAEAVAGIVIDFYGRLAAVRTGPNIVGFVIPEGGTVLDADPIGLLKGAPNNDLAAQFIRFVVSPEGQKIWVLKAGAPGGPRKSALGRLSVVEYLYKTQGPNLFDPKDPFDPGPAATTLTMNADLQKKRNAFIGDLIKSALIDNHAGLVRARRAIAARGDPAALLAKLEAPPSFTPARVTGNELTYDNSKIITEDRQGAVAAELSPPKDDPRALYLERIQNHLKDVWRDEYSQRFAEAYRLAQ